MNIYFQLFIATKQHLPPSKTTNNHNNPSIHQKYLPNLTLQRPQEFLLRDVNIRPPTEPQHHGPRDRVQQADGEQVLRTVASAPAVPPRRHRALQWHAQEGQVYC